MKKIKTIYSQNDLAITNAFGSIVIDLSHPDLIKDFYAVDKVYIYPKSKALTEPISRTMGLESHSVKEISGREKEGSSTEFLISNSFKIWLKLPKIYVLKP